MTPAGQQRLLASPGQHKDGCDIMSKFVESAQQAYWDGDWDGARLQCDMVLEDNSIGVAAPLPATIAEIAALAFQFLDHETAKKASDALIARAPENLNYRNQYASILSRTGEFERAEEQLRQALAIDDKHANTYFNLSLIHKADAGDPMIARLEEFLRDPALSQADQYACRLALGKFYDDISEFDKAFACYDTAMRSPEIAYDHAEQIAFFEKIKSTFSRALFESNEGSGEASRAPVFFVGMPRSGSSLLETLLDRHPRIAALGERIELSILAEAIARSTPKNNYLDSVPLLEADALKAYGADYCRRLSPLARGAERFIDKNLLNFQRAGLIHAILPQSTIIHTRRDPVDTCLSCYFQTLDPAVFPFTFDLSNIGQYYGLYADMMSHWAETIPDRIVDANYESLIEDPESAVNSLVENTGLSPADAVDTKTASDNTIIATASAWQARQPIYDSSVRRWKSYEKHLGPLFEALEGAGVTLSDAG